MSLREKMGHVLMVAYVSTAAGQVANQLFFFLIYGLLPTADVGIYSWAAALAMVYTYVLDLGLAPFLVGELSKAKYGLRSVLGVIALARLPVLVLGLAILLLWRSLAHPTGAEFGALTLVGLSFVVQLFDVALASWFQVWQRQNLLNLAGCVLPGSRLLGAVILRATGHLSLSSILWLTVLTQLAYSLGFVLWASAIDRRDLELGGTRDHGAKLRDLLGSFWLRGPKLTLMYTMVAIQGRLDWILVAVFLSKEALANYSLANKVVEVAMLFAAIWARSSFPWLSLAGDQAEALRPRLALLRRSFLLFAAAAALVAAVWAVPVIHHFWHEKYAQADLPIRIMAPLIALFMANQLFLYWILAARRESEYTLVVLGATLLQVGLNVGLLRVIGLSAAAYGMLGMGIVIHVGQMRLLVRHGMLTWAAAARQEAFLAASAAILCLGVYFGVGPWKATAIEGGCIAALAGAFLLERGDARLVGNWIRTEIRA